MLIGLNADDAVRVVSKRVIPKTHTTTHAHTPSTHAHSLDTHVRTGARTPASTLRSARVIAEPEAHPQLAFDLDAIVQSDELFFFMIKLSSVLTDHLPR